MNIVCMYFRMAEHIYMYMLCVFLKILLGGCTPRHPSGGMLKYLSIDSKQEFLYNYVTVDS